jgi:ankyrin repeat protein
MKHILITTIAAVLLVGCGKSTPQPKPLSEADSALLNAVDEGNIEAVKQQLASGANINAKNIEGETPLLLASYNGSKDIIELLINKGADLNVRGFTGSTPLHSVSLNKGSEKLWEALDDETKSNMDFGRERKRTDDEDAEIAQKLISSGANKNAVDNTKNTPLHSAIFDQHFKIVEVLIKNRVKVNETNNFGRTPLDLAIGQTNITSILIENGARYSGIWHAAAAGDIEGVNYFLDLGVDVNKRPERLGGTPLSAAITFGHSETADLLRKHGGKTGEELKAEGK